MFVVVVYILLFIIIIIFFCHRAEIRSSLVVLGCHARSAKSIQHNPSDVVDQEQGFAFACVCFCAMASASVRASLRSILRSVGHKSERGLTVLTRFRESRHIQDQQQLQKLQNIAHDYAEMLAATREKHRLIILDSGAERVLDGKELVRRSARRVGLDMHK